LAVLTREKSSPATSAYVRLATNAEVAGEDFSRVKTAKLDVQAYQYIDRFQADASRSGGFLDFGDADNHDADDDSNRYRPARTIFWETTVFILGEPNPVLEIDGTGKITFKTWNVYVKAFDPVTNTFSALLDVDNVIASGSWIVVGDLIYDESGLVTFDTNGAEDVNSHAGGSDDNHSVIYGNAGEIWVQELWDSVTITNYSDRRLVINDIDVTSGPNDPVITINVDDVPGPITGAGTPANGDPNKDDDPPSLELSESSKTTFEFDLLHKFPTTDVQIRNLQPVGFTVGNSDIYLDGDIENPIGRTYIQNVRGNILADDLNLLHGIEGDGVTLIGGHFVSHFSCCASDTDYELIRTNILQLDASGSVGHQADAAPRVPIAAELVRFRHIDAMICPGGVVPANGCLFDIKVQAKAGNDLVVDLTGNERSLAIEASSLNWQADYLWAGNDIDVVVNDSIQGVDAGTVADASVVLHDPPDLTTPQSGSGPYHAHFRPDVMPPMLQIILRALGVSQRDPVDSTWTFGDAANTYGDVRAGDDITICHVDTRNYSQESDYATAPLETCETRDPTSLNYARGPPDLSVRVNFVVFSDTASTTLPYPAPPVELDDGIAIDVHQIFLVTDGDITNTELIGDMLVGHIESTAHDVTLNSPARILDSDRTPTIDVGGVNITMTTTGSGIGGIGVPTTGPNPGNPQPGDAGNLGGYLEINTDITGSHTGVLKAFDTAPNDAQTLGIYLDEIVGDMPLHTVWTEGNAADLATGNVSLRTVKGSIVDAKPGHGTASDDAEILAQTVDLDANGGSIGTGTNDVEIDSSRSSTFTCASINCADVPTGNAAPNDFVSDPGLTNDGANATDDVGLEATDSIHLTEVASYLRLVFAHTVNGDIVITVRNSSAHDEDLFLVKSGSARFAESNVRLPSGNDVDAPRDVPHGSIFAETGNVVLRVGDDMTTHQNTQIVAHGNITVFGDYGGTVDATYGSTVILRGKIVADAVVTAGPQSGDPMGTYLPNASAHPTAKTQIFGNVDIDTFQLGDPSGFAGFGSLSEKTNWNDPGFIFLGSKTEIYGSATAPVCNATSCLSADVNPYAAVPIPTHATPDPNLDEDHFVVWYLQSTNVVADPLGLTQNGPGAGHALTLDGQSDTDYYAIYTTGSHGSYRNYVINVLDTGAPNNGVDELAIYGADNNDPFFNGYIAGSTTPNATDDIFLLRATKCIDNQDQYTVNSSVPSSCLSPTEKADRPAFVAVLGGNNDPDGGVGLYRDVDPLNAPSTKIQRINYDTGLNGRLSVFGRGGNDAFFVDDTTVTSTLDGGAGYDLFQIGQIFGAKRDAAAGALLPTDTFPVLIATTRGWLSPGPHAPLVATGGTGNDEFVVYSNQAELRLEGDDDNDLFVVRAFAIAAVCDTDATGDGKCLLDDVTLSADPTTSLYPVDTNGNGVCSAAENATYQGDGWNPATGRKDNNGDGICNDADAHMTTNPDQWEDDTIPLDANGVAVPVIGLGFSAARPIDIRAGGGEDEVQYNVNAPVSVDGGTGFDKLVVLGTEFADDIVITATAIYGAGLNVRYTTIEVVEVDGLEGDDEFFVQSTAFGVAYRVIGGLGSDTINVTGDVVEDIVTKELEGISGTIDHQVTSTKDPLYNGLPVDGVEYNLATPDAGVVVIRESGPGTSVREGGSAAVGTIDYYDVFLSHAPTSNVYVTISAARDPQEEADNSFLNPLPLPSGNGDSIWLCAGTAAQCTDPTTHLDSKFKRYTIVNGVPVDVNGRALVLTFTPGAWDDSAAQRVWVFAPDDPRSEGDRVVVVQHTVISADKTFDAALVRNVEVTVYDNDTPGIYVTQIERVADGVMTACPVSGCVEDKRTVVVEGSLDPAVGEYTGTDDDLLIQLAKKPAIGQTIVVKISMDADSQKQLSLFNVTGDSRMKQHTALDGGTYYTIEFDDTNWDKPVRVREIARDDPVREDPFTAVMAYSCDDSSLGSCGQFGAAHPLATYQFPNLRSGSLATPVTVIDNDTAGVVVRESGVDTVVVKCGDPLCSMPGQGDDYWIRLTKRPTDPNDPSHSTPTTVQVAILTDGLVDVASINGTPVTVADLKPVGGYIPSRLFLGNATFGTDGTHRTITRANGSELGSYVDEGFEKGQTITIVGAGAGYDGQYTIFDLTDTLMTLTSTTMWAANTTTDFSTAINKLTKSGLYDGKVSVEVAGAARRLVRDINDPILSASWLADGFLEGQRVEVCQKGTANCARFKIAIIRGDNKTKDNKIEFTSETALPAWLTGTVDVTVTRIAAVATFDDKNGGDPNWYKEQQITLVADLAYSQPIQRQGVKVFPVQTHLLSKLQGPLAVEGGVTGADRSLNLGVKLPGEKDGPLFAIGTQPPESKQIDVLNIFNDGSQQDRIGTMTSTTISGLGLPKDLNFGPSYSSGNPQTFGEPAIFPGGISYGTVQFVDGTFKTDGGKSTIEVVNLMLGSGNDTFQVNGTLDPDAAVKLIGSIILTPRAAGTLGAGDPGGVDVTRTQPFDWKSQGFLVGQPVHIDGFASATWTVLGFDDDFAGDTTLNTVMHLAGTILAAPLQPTSTKNVTVTINGAAFGGQLTRTSGSWLTDGFVAGQRVTIAGTTGAWRVLAVTATDMWLGFGGPISDVLAPTLKAITWTTPVLHTTTADDVAVKVTLPVTIVSNNLANERLSDGGTVTRAAGSWTADGFLAGQWVMITGISGIGWRLLSISADGKTLTLGRGAPLPSSAADANNPKVVFVPGPHGGLTQVHGGGNMPVALDFDNLTLANTVTVSADGNSITRKDGSAWSLDGYAQLYANGLPMHIQVGTTSQTRTIDHFGNALCSLPDPYPGCGNGSVMFFTSTGVPVQPPVTTGAGTTRVSVAEPKRIQVSGATNVSVTGGSSPTSTLTCPTCNFSGFINGMQITVSGFMTTATGGGTAITDVGLPGTYTILSHTATTITLANVALTPTYHLDVNGVYTADYVPLTITGYDPLHPENGPAGVHIGGDTITVGISYSGAFTKAGDRITGVDWAALGFAVGQTVQIADVAGSFTIKQITGTTMVFNENTVGTGAGSIVALAGSLAGPNSPLVVYGDTSQDGAWYAGHPYDILGYEFGPKPFDPFPKIPDAENEDDEWVFPLANPYAYAGNDVIDAHSLFAGVTCSAASCNLPSVGFTAYGGEGNDLIIGKIGRAHV